MLLAVSAVLSNGYLWLCSNCRWHSQIVAKHWTTFTKMSAQCLPARSYWVWCSLYITFLFYCFSLSLL